ncbi:2-hydroxyacyl-CoA dehydratase subunit D [Konateibacter massiliensis]|uniref:2-hydroxyacyl-CoA dehydratase subunit D n=1 Tax=Konateibacter massiliensis TaxID=2002841 RepID=UPI000C14D549|nr:2-hydroxyacyl-CoA dehydratase family protein [Konateibacter massiliensis]
MSSKEILTTLKEIALNPKKQKERYLAEGKKIVLTAPVYTPEEIIHAMDLVPMGAWGADLELKESKVYFPAFICSIVQSIVELGIKGTYEGVSAIVVPSLCDSLKVLGENWKYAVPSIPFIPMTYPQNRRESYGIAYTCAGYERVIADLERTTGNTFSEEKLVKTIAIYNEHNRVMRELSSALADHPEVSATDRSAVFKSAYFMLKEEHTALVKKLVEALKQETPAKEKTRIMTTGILADSASFLQILDKNGMHIVDDDIAAESRQYRIDTKQGEAPLLRLAEKFGEMGHCSVLYDADKKRIARIVQRAKEYDVKGIILVLTKFCDPEEFDYPLMKKACEQAEIPLLLVEVDRQMVDYAQAETMIETFSAMMAG